MLIDLCLDSEESCKDVRYENDLNDSRKKQKRSEKKHQSDLQGGFQSRLTAGYVNFGSGPIPFFANYIESLTCCDRPSHNQYW